VTRVNLAHPIELSGRDGIEADGVHGAQDRSRAGHPWAGWTHLNLPGFNGIGTVRCVMKDVVT
jgi:hypothetical protein